eukprot:8787076-Pyramimonas_sp.AAC.1
MCDQKKQHYRCHALLPEALLQAGHGRVVLHELRRAHLNLPTGRGSAGVQEGVKRGSGVGQEGIFPSSLDARKPQNGLKVKNTGGIFK